MRVWLPVTELAFEQFFETGSIQCDLGFAVTPDWEQLQSDSDLDVLEDDILYEAGQSGAGHRVVLVADVASEVLGQVPGQVLPGPVTRRDLQAVFARGDVDDQFSWFGPTESLSVLEFLGRAAH